MYCGIVYEELVYCNVHPQGLPEEVWIDDFAGFDYYYELLDSFVQEKGISENYEKNKENKKGLSE